MGVAASIVSEQEYLLEDVKKLAADGDSPWSEQDEQKFNELVQKKDGKGLTNTEIMEHFPEYFKNDPSKADESKHAEVVDPAKGDEAAALLQSRARGMLARKAVDEKKKALAGEPLAHEEILDGIVAEELGKSSSTKVGGPVEEVKQADNGGEAQGDQAAALLQSRARGMLARKHVDEKKKTKLEIAEQEKAAVLIQARARGMTSRLHGRKPPQKRKASMVPTTASVKEVDHEEGAAE